MSSDGATGNGDLVTQGEALVPESTYLGDTVGQAEVRSEMKGG